MINPTQIDIIGPIGGDEGWHVNMPEAAMDAALEAWRLTPAPETPLRVYAGDTPPFALTAFLCFPDEATGRALLGVAADG